jgi:hypothetical protein
MLDEPALTLYRDGEVRAPHNLNADWGASFRLSTRHFLDVLAGRESEEALTAQEGRRVIAFYDLFQRSNAERRALAGWFGESDRGLSHPSSRAFATFKAYRRLNGEDDCPRPFAALQEPSHVRAGSGGKRSSAEGVGCASSCPSRSKGSSR